MNLELRYIEDLHDAALAGRLQHRLDQKTKPLGALGRLESLALQLGLRHPARDGEFRVGGGVASELNLAAAA